MARKMTGEEVLVVPIKEDAFAAARKLHLYAIPIERSTSDVDYVAFYRGAPISAITHYAKVKSISKNVSYRELFPMGSTIVAQEDMPLKVYHLDAMVQFRRRVKKGRNPPVSGPRYAGLAELRKGRYLDEVWTTPDEEKAPEGKEAKAGGKAPKKEKPKPPEKAVPKESPPQAPAEEKKRKRGRRKRKKEEPAPKEPPKPPAKEEPKEKKRRRRRGKKGEAKEGVKEAPKKEAKPAVHYIVDGSNVALEARSFKEGGRLKQLRLLMDKLASEKGAAVTVIIDANLRHHIDRKDELERMIRNREVLQAPAQTDADEFVIQTAESHRSRGENVVIVTNDRYQDYIAKYKPRFDWVRGAQQRFMFVLSPDGGEPIDVMLSLS